MLEDYWENLGIIISLFFLLPVFFLCILLILISIIICFPIWVGYALIKILMEN